MTGCPWGGAGVGWRGWKRHSKPFRTAQNRVSHMTRRPGGKECNASISELLVFMLVLETVTSAFLLHTLSAISHQQTRALPPPNHHGHPLPLSDAQQWAGPETACCFSAT